MGVKLFDDDHEQDDDEALLDDPTERAGIEEVGNLLLLLQAIQQDVSQQKVKLDQSVGSRYGGSHMGIL
jgi:hypothetical protein